MSTAAKPLYITRLRFIYVAITIVFAIFIARAFYMQVIRYDYYNNRALAGQLKQYEIPAERGTIRVSNGSGTVPLVLNQKLFTVYADPTLVKNSDRVADKLSIDLQLDRAAVLKQITQKDTRYSVIAKKISPELKAKLLAYKFAGIGAQEQTYRTYPQGAMAAQLLGIVDDAGTGRYGIEQALNKQLTGTPGELKAVTDINGVPLAANDSNTLVAPLPGEDITLTIDAGIQKQLETTLASRIKENRAEQISAVIMEANTGAIAAMANYPSYDPAQSSSVEDATLFNNAAVSNPIEVGSIMKSLTVAAGLDSGAVNPSSSYYDPASYVVDEFRITNIEEDGGPGNKNLYDLLNLSLNTGATWLLMQMGGGNINEKARNTWHSYLTDHYRLGLETGIEQGYEDPGYVPKPQDNGAGINLTYANTSFGQAMTATPLQMAAAFSGVMNGGTYYQPHLVAATTDSAGKTTAQKPKVLKSNVVKPAVSTELAKMLQYAVDNHYFAKKFDQNRYMVGGKTGTAEVALPGGGYSKTQFNGTYLGFVGGDKPQYIIAIQVIKPIVKGYAGSGAAQPIFCDLAHMLINGSYVSPKN
jgi:cell division protein FtsI (penicillin-binding protein 3)